VRGLFPEGRFFEIFVVTPLEVCKERDPKGLYEKAERGEIKEFTGVSSPYERPEDPDLVVHGNGEIETLVEEVRRQVEQHVELGMVR